MVDETLKTTRFSHRLLIGACAVVLPLIATPPVPWDQIAAEMSRAARFDWEAASQRVDIDCERKRQTHEFHARREIIRGLGMVISPVDNRAVMDQVFIGAFARTERFIGPPPKTLADARRWNASNEGSCEISWGALNDGIAETLKAKLADNSSVATFPALPSRVEITDSQIELCIPDGSHEQCASVLNPFGGLRVRYHDGPPEAFVPDNDIWNAMEAHEDIRDLLKLDMPVAVQAIKALRDKQSGDVTVAGFVVPGPLAQVVLPIALVALLLQLLAHARHLRVVAIRQSEEKTLRDFPWTPLFGDAIGAIVGFGSVVAVPVAASVGLAFRFRTGTACVSAALATWLSLACWVTIRGARSPAKASPALEKDERILPGDVPKENFRAAVVSQSPPRTN